MTAARRQEALAFFTRQGWTLAQSAGIVANLEAESGLRPDAIGDGGAAYGIAQWHPDRQSNFRAIMGRDIRGSSFEHQLYFVHAELQSTEKRAGDALSACTSAAEAGACVSRLYERPADREGEAAKRATLAESIYAAAQEGAGAPIAEPEAPTPTPTETKPMLPLLLPALLQSIPQLIGIFGKNGERAQMNAQAAQIAVDAVVKATEAVNLQAALEKMQADPEAKAKATAEVLQTPAIAALLEATEAGGGGIAGARKAAADPAAVPFWKAAPFYVSLLLLALVGAVVVDVLYVHPGNWRPEDRAQVLMFAVAIASAVSSYFLGSSISSARKDAALLARQ